ncbi:glycosyltransferase 87 family protein [Streptomyces sp. NBC_00083]|uniref:glycosyltransferase 87 family protein n=1 Tax=Streptomyces sp. NBC_00083 TaxID=2975647 RepID=UPI00225080E7|nr:glycosyltransferase 87 family protein [Streptomyces sp. NBC_00083]MCX5386602.1 glycosyltransferase 87 family protein [Streptomyces sp. NBC_00083]
MTHRRTVCTAVLLAALTTVLAFTVLKDGFRLDPAGLSWWYAAAWALFAVTAWSVRKVPARHRAALIVAGGIAVAATGLLAPPRTSTDAYRYAWDGRVQAAGISPYDYAPGDPRLARLRDPWLFPTSRAQCARPERARVDGGCTRLNRPAVHTIYPPVAEAYYLVVDEISPGGARLKPLQIGGALFAVGTTLVLVRVLRRRGRDGAPGDVSGAAFWAWCPAVPLEAVNNAHVDVLAVLMTVAGLAALTGGRAVGRLRAAAGGALIGAGVAVKMLPAMVLPAVLRKRPVTVLLSTTATVALSYLPYVLASHSSVLGYLSGYTEEEGYDDPTGQGRFALIRMVLPDSWGLPVALIALAAVTGYVMWRGYAERPWSGALLLFGWAFLLLTPGYSWYALLVVALVALDGRWEWLTLAMAGACTYVVAKASGDFPMARVAYSVAACAVLAGWLVRRRLAGRPERSTSAGEVAAPERVTA